MNKYIIIVLLLSLVSTISAQYTIWNQPMELRFERQSFFYVPQYMNPFGVDEFASSLPGAVDHPLLNLQINPANFSLAAERTEFFLEYRTNKEIARSNNFYRIMPAFYDASIVPPYPYWSSTKLSVEPAFSTALLGKPLPESAPDLFVGGSFELIAQSEPYYPIDQDIPYYPMELSQKINSSYEGVNYMKNRGHFLTLFTGYNLTPTTSIGLSAGQTLYKRDGQNGPKSSNYVEADNTSSSLYDDNRGQHHTLWNITLGIQTLVLENLSIGGTAGYFNGTLTQHELFENISYYFTTSGGITTYLSSNLSQFDRRWVHNGDGYIGGINAELALSGTMKFVAAYSYRRNELGIDLHADDKTNFQYRNVSQTTTYSNGNASSEYRTGSGHEYSDNHRVSAAFILRTEKNVRLSFGFVISELSERTNSREFVLGDSRSENESTPDPWTSTRKRESKYINWNSNDSRGEIQIPFLASLPLNEMFTMMIGVNRRFITVEQQQTTMIQNNWIQRYKNDILESTEFGGSMLNEQPRYMTTTNTLSVLAGFSLAPNELLNVHLIAIPYTVNNQLNLQWLAGVNVTP